MDLFFKICITVTASFACFYASSAECCLSTYKKSYIVVTIIVLLIGTLTTVHDKPQQDKLQKTVDAIKIIHQHKDDGKAESSLSDDLKDAAIDASLYALMIDLDHTREVNSAAMEELIEKQRDLILSQKTSLKEKDYIITQLHAKINQQDKNTSE